jgi:hypothetical protein
MWSHQLEKVMCVHAVRCMHVLLLPCPLLAPAATLPAHPFLLTPPPPLPHHLPSPPPPTHTPSPPCTQVPRRCGVEAISFSAHADYEQTSGFLDTLRPPHVVLVHGEAERMARLKAVRCMCVWWWWGGGGTQGKGSVCRRVEGSRVSLMAVDVCAGGKGPGDGLVD